MKNKGFAVKLLILAIIILILQQLAPELFEKQVPSFGSSSYNIEVETLDA